MNHLHTKDLSPSFLQPFSVSLQKLVRRHHPANISETDLTLMITLSAVGRSHSILPCNWLPCRPLWWKCVPSLCLDFPPDAFGMFDESLALARLYLMRRQQTKTRTGRSNLEPEWMNSDTCQVDKSDFYCQFSQVAAAQVFLLVWGCCRAHVSKKINKKISVSRSKSLFITSHNSALASFFSFYFLINYLI